MATSHALDIYQDACPEIHSWGVLRTETVHNTRPIKIQYFGMPPGAPARANSTISSEHGKIQRHASDPQGAKGNEQMTVLAGASACKNVALLTCMQEITCNI